MRKNKYFWVFLILLASISSADESTPKPKKKLTLQDLLKAPSSSSKKHSATVAGVRGLEETSGEVDTQARNFVAVEKLEKIVISQGELKAFLAEGKLK